VEATLHRDFRGLQAKILTVLDDTNTSQKEELDGVDLDWEAPQSREDYHSYMQLVQEMHNQLTATAGILISVALHPRQMLPKASYDNISRINLMTYDMIDGTGGHHASVELMKTAIYQLAAAGCPKNKIVVGIPAYARHGRNPGQVKTYSEIVDALVKNDPNADFKAVESRSSLKGFLFDSPAAVRQKVHFAIENGYAGVFFWELGQDKQHSEWAQGGILLEAAAEQAKSRRASKGSRNGEL
jgi:chitinase